MELGVGDGGVGGPTTEFLISPNQLLANKQLNSKLIKVTLGWLMV